MIRLALHAIPTDDGYVHLTTTRCGCRPLLSRCVRRVGGKPAYGLLVEHRAWTDRKRGRK